MDAYSTSHLVMLAAFVVGLPLAVLLGRWERRTGTRTLSRAAALAIPLVHVPTQVYDVATRFELGVSLPFHLSDLAWMAAAVALWTHHRYAVALTYFWGLVLTTQAIVTPSLGEDFPDVRYFAYWFIHLLVVWAAVFLVWGHGLAPRWRDYRFTVAVTFTWAVCAYAFNEVAGTNYGYLQRKPGGGSALDLLGPWPVYVFAEIGIVLVVWALMTWPWVQRASAGRGADLGGQRLG
ncbi:TIGR02206 family membrane protein [Nocardioides sp. cx-169]|uniref:YwaF family protein n=1 Tax=Nocardioides sp. cx-169 TaxID=2899080 RepID=UPI001E62179F|nr:TIGR02206 family membrane protein [Nocardioides sp. cx-169]MCD4535246.1 TIGR02206 family membrane protein [Nocardioides sp. cx-169]